MNKLPIFNIVLGDEEGITKMSLVESPAVESDFMAFAEQTPMQFSINDPEQMVFGCALRADFPIYRCNNKMGEFYVVFTKDTIKQLYTKFMRERRTNKVNLEHSDDTNDVYMVQSFIKDTENGINPVGFENISDGSWFVQYKVENKKVWNSVKEGKFKGFSIECFTELELVDERTTDEMEELVNTILG